MRQFLFSLLVIFVLGMSMALAIAFLLFAVEIMDNLSRVDRRYVSGAANGLAMIGFAIAVIIAGLGLLLICIRYASRLPYSTKEYFDRLAKAREKNQSGKIS